MTISKLLKLSFRISIHRDEKTVPSEISVDFSSRPPRNDFMISILPGSKVMNLKE